MGVEFKTKKGGEYRDGNEILRYKICIPRIEGCERINELYLRISEECESFCKNILACESEKRYAYLLDYAITHSSEDMICLLMRVRVMCGTNVIERFVDAHTWSISRQSMIPPRTLRKKFAGRDGRAKKREPIFLCGDELKILSGTDIDSFFRGRR